MSEFTSLSPQTQIMVRIEKEGCVLGSVCFCIRGAVFEEKDVRHCKTCTTCFVFIQGEGMNKFANARGLVMKQKVDLHYLLCESIVNETILFLFLL